MSVIVIADVVKRYGTTTALAGVSLTIHRGEAIGVIGPTARPRSWPRSSA